MFLGHWMCIAVGLQGRELDTVLSAFTFTMSFLNSLDILLKQEKNRKLIEVNSNKKITSERT